MDKLIKIRIFSPEKKKLLINQIQVEEVGYYAGSSNRWNEKNTQLTKDLLDSISKNDLNSINDQTFYRCPKLSLPREKMNVINEKYNTKVIRDITKADRIIVSEKFINGLFAQSWDSIMSTDDFRNVINLSRHKGKIFTSEVSEQFEKMDLQNNYFTVDVPSNYYAENDAIEELEKIVDASSKARGYHHYVPLDLKSTLDEMFDNKDKLIWDSALAAKSTEDALIIDVETYTRLSQMFTGDDKDNWMLGLEMMANCNFNKSTGFIALLFFRFAENRFKATKSWNHVNVKTMRQKFEKYNLTYARHNSSPYNQFIELLVQDAGLTTFVMEAMLDTVYDNVVESTFGISAETVFEFNRSHLKLKPEYAEKCIDKNIGEVLLKETFDDLPF